MDLLQLMPRPDLDMYFGNKTTAKAKQPIYFEPTQPSEYCIIQNEFPVCNVVFILLTVPAGRIWQWVAGVSARSPLCFRGCDLDTASSVWCSAMQPPRFFIKETQIEKIFFPARPGDPG